MTGSGRSTTLRTMARRASFVSRDTSAEVGVSPATALLSCKTVVTSRSGSWRPRAPPTLDDDRQERGKDVGNRVAEGARQGETGAVGAGLRETPATGCEDDALRLPAVVDQETTVIPSGSEGPGLVGAAMRRTSDLIPR